MKLSIIIPIFNERATIEELLNRVSASATPGYAKEIILVDDGSTDGTSEILPGLARIHHALLARHQNNKGKGAAVQSALKHASGDLVLIQDADLEYDPAQYAKLLGAHTPRTPVVYGSRNLQKTNRGYSHYVLGAALLTRLTNVLFGSRLTDVYTCYKLFPRAVMSAITLEKNGFSFEAEITAKLLKHHVPIIEIPIDYYPRSFSEGKKIRFRDAVSGACTILASRIRRS